MNTSQVDEPGPLRDACTDIRRHPFSTFVHWPIFLACSWTWCIGMYLPILLIERYGWWSLAAFAIPNVAGVILFGQYLRTTNMSRAMIGAHRPALLWFSAITVAFHGWFFGWIWQAEMNIAPGWSILIGLVVTSLAAMTSALSDRWVLRISVVAYALSVAFMVVAAGTWWGTGDEPAAPGPGESIWSAAQAGWWIFFAPIMVMGFLFCPYFDLSFHRAYERVTGGANGRATFLMFGIFFTVMLGFTCIYALTGFIWPVVIHLLVQGWLTMAIHFRELRERSRMDQHSSIIRRVGFPAPFALVFLAPLPIIDYRAWFVFYGIVFPVYAMLHGVRRLLGRSEADTSSIALAILIGVPFGAIGFLMGQEWALLMPPIIALMMTFAGGRELKSAVNGAARH